MTTSTYPGPDAGPDAGPNARKLRERLGIEVVFAWYGAVVVGTGRKRRAHVCPACGERSRPDAVLVDVGSRRWQCYVCKASGSIFDAIAGFERFDIGRDFPRAVSRAAEIAGRRGAAPSADPAPVTDISKDVAASASFIWSRLALFHPRGMDYLQARGLDARGLIAAGVVRFWRSGDPAVALYDEHGAVVNLVRRMLDPTAPKAVGLRGGTNRGTLIGSVDKIARGADVVVCEGVTDALAASLLWPDAVVCGAAGAPCMPHVAELVGRRLLAVGSGRVLLAVDDDAAGAAAGSAAVDALLAVGVPKTWLEVPPLGNAPDVAAAYANGWRPR